jgi:hypothetical protein
MSRLTPHTLHFFRTWKHGKIWCAGPLIICGLAAFLVLGCKEETIEHYTAPKADEPPPMQASSDRPAGRMLGLILPHGEVTWFFKLVGRTAEIDEHKEEFEQFLRSIEFNDGANPPIQWEVPESWRKTASPEGRFATFRLGPKDAGLELTVLFFANGAKTSDTLANVNRWRNQLGLPQISKAELGAYVTDLKLKAGPSAFVDLTSRAQLGGNHGVGNAKPTLKYAKPEGWKEHPDPKGIRLYVFEIKDGNLAAEAGVSVFPGDGGGLLMNVNRWRDQVGIPHVSEEQLRNDLTRMEVDGTPAQMVDLTGPDAAGRPRQRLLGVVVAHGDRTWFLTLKGPQDLVAKQKANFDAFLASVRFEGAK